MKNKKLSLYSNIYFGISLVAPIFIFFFDINSLFMIAYSPMSPDFIGGKTFLAAFYLVAAIAVYISLLFKKRAPIFALFALSAVFEIFNLLSPAVSSGEKISVFAFFRVGKPCINGKNPCSSGYRLSGIYKSRNKEQSLKNRL